MKSIAYRVVLLGLALAATAAEAAPASTAQQLFQNNCAVCHGANLEGGIGPTLLQHRWLHGEPTRANLQRVIKNGVPDKGMPPWSAALNPAEIERLADYVASDDAEAQFAFGLRLWLRGLESLRPAPPR